MSVDYNAKQFVAKFSLFTCQIVRDMVLRNAASYGKHAMTFDSDIHSNFSFMASNALIF
jgi:hypothetical protein